MQIGMLGAFEVRTDDGVVVDVPGARLRGLLVALALRPGQVVPKATLVDWIWGEQPPAEAGNALQRLVSRLRKLLPDGVIEGQPDGYRLLVDADAVDAIRFERLLGQTRTDPHLLSEALGLWRGDAMQDVGLQDSTAYDAAVTRLEGLRLTALENRFDAEINRGRGAELVTELTDLVALHPVRERLVAALMQALAAAGRNADALLLYERTREALADSLGVDPSPELSAVHVALLRGEFGRREDERRTNLRAELTSYVGKATDIGMVRELVAGHRLTTLVGPGGAGKTRLAAEAGRTLVDDEPDGVWLVELAPIGSDGDVAQATLAALSLRDGLLSEVSEVDPTDRVITALREREALLILDNCEHVIEAAATFAHRVLGECRRLRILATSREPLGITGEALWHVVPLTLPTDEADSAEIEASPAVQLLRDRAAAVRTDIAIDAHTLATMARVCRALDGMPLAIELAAARLRTMSLDQLADRLDDVFRLLTGGSRTALPRQRTLRAVIDWSWALLSDAERMVLRRLSVFYGGASLEAAERVCAGDTVDPDQVLELLTALTEKSLVVADTGKSPRYRMLGTIKEYAAQRLAEAGESDLARHAHLRYFTELAETALPHLRRAEQLDWIALLADDHDNLSAAMRAATAAGEAQEAMRLAASAAWYWWVAGHKTEGSELVTAATEIPGEVTDEVRAAVYAFVVQFLSSGVGDEHQAAEWIHKAYRYSQLSKDPNPVLSLIAPLEQMLRDPAGILPAWEALLDHEDPWVRAMARLQLGKMRAVFGGDGEQADQDLRLALDAFRATGERFGISFALAELAERTITRGRFAEARDYLDQAAAVVTEFGAVDDVIRIHARLGQVYWLMGDHEASAAAMAEAQRYAERVPWAGALVVLALTKAELAGWNDDAEEALRQLDLALTILGPDAEQASIRAAAHSLRGYFADDLDEARKHRVAAFDAATEAGHPALIAQTIVGVAHLAMRRKEYERAAQLLAASNTVRGLPDLSQPAIHRIEDAARRHLGETHFTEALHTGSQADWQQLVAAALAA
ncbi:BTAD domain-containing putative transcriptional regulator [Kribbella sp. NPDC055071]